MNKPSKRFCCTKYNLVNKVVPAKPPRLLTYGASRLRPIDPVSQPLFTNQHSGRKTMNVDIDAPAKTCHWCGKTIYPDIDSRCCSSTNGQYYYCNSECQQEELHGSLSSLLMGTASPSSIVNGILARQSRKKKIQKRMEEERHGRTEPQVATPKKKRSSCGCIVLIIIGLLILAYIL